ncbi:MAG: tetratricopeptide repeat protein [Deltaproteobacteria bacterium]|nr:tetratricopeptide repeat protein [Deltaproteobacteria bacterium]
MSPLATLLITLALAAAPTPAAPPASTAPTSDDPQVLFAAANARYFAGDYNEAVRLYADIVTRFRTEDAALYHNLGNAYFRSGAYGSAILYYQRALRLEPPEQLQTALVQNRDAARRTLQSRYRSTSDEALVYGDPSGVLYQVTHVIGRVPLAVMFAVVWAGLFALLALRRLLPKRDGEGARWPGRAAVPVGILAALLGFLLWGQVTSDADHRIGVVVSDSAKLRDGRHETAQGRGLPEGLEVKILDGDDAWTQVELASGRRGWVQAAQVKQI